MINPKNVVHYINHEMMQKAAYHEIYFKEALFMISQKEKDKRTQKRREDAVKSSTSIRFSEKEKLLIQKKADEHNMKFSEYVRDKVKHADEGLTPYQKMKSQNLINTAYDLIKDTNPEKAEQLRKEMNEIWNW